MENHLSIGARVRYRDGDTFRRAIVEAISERRITISFFKWGRRCVSRVRPYMIHVWDEKRMDSADILDEFRDVE